MLGSLNGRIGVFHVKVDDDSLSKSITWRGVHPFHTLVVLLPQSNSLSSCGGQPVHYLLASMGWCLSPQTHMNMLVILSRRHPCPLHITWNLHPSSVDTPVDIHRRSCSFPFIHLREVFLAWCWVITRPLSPCDVVLLSLPLGVGLTGVGLVHPSCAWWTPTCKGTWASDTTVRSWLWCRMHEFPWSSFTSYEGTSVMIWNTTSWGLSSHLSRIFLFPWKVSALTGTRLLGFQTYGTNLPVVTPLLSLSYCCRLELGLLKSGPQAISYSSYISLHTLGGDASLWDLCAP